MSSHQIFQHPNLGTISLTKHPRAKRYKVRITPTGVVAITVPKYGSFRAAKQFALDQQAWIQKHRPRPIIIKNGDQIGRKHAVTTISNTDDDYNNVLNIRFSEDASQSELRKRAIEALRVEAKELLPERVSYLSDKSELGYNKLQVKNMTSRWGSYSSNKNISLSIYLVQLRDSLVDYVIWHELCHSRQPNHSAAFWELLEQHCPDYRGLKQELGQIRPTLLPNHYSNMT